MDNLQLPKESGKDAAYNLLKGALGAIPLVGSIAAETFGLILTSPITQRREDWMSAVVEKLKELEQRKDDFNIEGLEQNQEFVSFLLETSSVAFKTHQEEKLHILKNAVANFFMDNDLEYDKKYSFIRIIDEVTPTHLKVLFFIQASETFIIASIRGYPQLLEEYQKENGDIDKFYFRKCIRDLEKQSLLRVSTDFADFVGGGGFSTDEAAPSIKLLDLGYEFIGFIRTQG